MRENKLSMVVQMRGKQGIFNTDKDVTLFHEHITTNELKDVVKAIKAELKKDLKCGQVSMDVLSMDMHYKRTDKLRLIVSTNWDGFMVDVRKFNGYDYADSTKYNFTSESQLLKYTVGLVESTIVNTMDDIPVDKGRYATKLDEKYANIEN